MVHNDLINNFFYLHVAFRYLTGVDAIQQVRYRTIVQDYLTTFLEYAKTIYSAEFITFNIHYLINVVDDVIYTQTNLNDFSAFPFENRLDKIN